MSAAPKTVEIFVYTDIKGDSFDWWSGEKIKSETSAEAFREKLAECGEFDNINIYINSLGGSVKEALAIYNQLKRHSAKKTAYVDGFCCSAATLIAMACDEVVMPRNTIMFIHNAWWITAGNSSQLRKSADDLDVVNGSAREIYLGRMTDALTEDELCAMMDAETYISAADCIKFGFADKFADYDADMEKAKAHLESATKDVKQNAEYGNFAAFADKLCASLEKLTVQAASAHPPAPAPVKHTPDDTIVSMAAAFYAVLIKNTHSKE